MKAEFAMNFMSNAFFHMFQSKKKADFACSIEIDETSFISKYMVLNVKLFSTAISVI